MKKIPHKHLALGLVLSIVVVVLVIKVYNEKFIDEDHIKRRWPGGKHGVTASNLEKAAADLEKRLTYLLPYISRCERFPLNLEDAYKPIKNSPEGCSPMTPTDREFVSSWIDPWERPYQIRYHKERRKLQIRSQGRHLDDESDDIVRETTLGDAGIIFDKEIEKCKKLSSDDKDCVFNRGWH